ncbi:MAG TPA: type II toxin-antitoxin system HicA family toxin [Chloroflexota bacterium]|nr:type II toxin-antitoxin system HicA family toxin [Chloroflexota bacterium]
MDKSELWRQIAERPNAVRFAELEKLLLAFGWRFERAGKGDHLIYARGGGERISIPYRRGTVLAVYVRQVLRMTEGEIDE